MNVHDLKQKQVRLSKLRAEINEEQARLANEQQALLHLRDTANRLQREIDDFLKSQKDPVVSEHAIVRYFERVLGYDIDQVRSKILTDRAKDMIRQLGNGTYPVDGFKIFVQNGCVTTIVDDNK